MFPGDARSQGVNHSTAAIDRQVDQHHFHLKTYCVTRWPPLAAKGLPLVAQDITLFHKMPHPSSKKYAIPHPGAIFFIPKKTLIYHTVTKRDRTFWVESHIIHGAPAYHEGVITRDLDNAHKRTQPASHNCGDRQYSKKKWKHNPAESFVPQTAVSDSSDGPTVHGFIFSTPCGGKSVYRPPLLSSHPMNFTPLHVASCMCTFITPVMDDITRHTQFTPV